MIASILLEGVADVLLKLASLRQEPLLLPLSLGFYILTMFAWMRASVCANALAIPGAIWLLGGLILTTFIGLHYGEVLTLRERAGVLLGAVAIVMICL
jgi:multidrug transporter EmrE-like cation transporter